MLEFNENGIYCPKADIYIDPLKPVDKAVITHGHSDHARWGNKKYLCHYKTVPILKLRLGKDIDVEGLEYGKVLNINGVKISLHPAGHIIGSAQVRLEYRGEIWLVSGDYKIAADGLSTPFETVKCHHFITESTFGLPVYKFPEPAEVYREMNAWWAQNAEDGFNSVFLGYALGKSQAILSHLDQDIGQIYVHGAVDNINKAMESVGYQFAGTRITAETSKATIRGAAIVAPPSTAGSPWLKKLSPYRLAFCSGWMQLRGSRRRRGADRGFVLSDHCDWMQLNQAVEATGAGQIYVTHGYQAPYAKWLKEAYGLESYEIRHLNSFGETDEL